MGEIPQQWMSENNLEQCWVCSKLLARRFGGTCPWCRPTLRASVSTASRPVDERPVPACWPSLEEVCTARIPTKAYVPQGARKLWAQCLAAALSQVHKYNDEKAWIQLLSLPQMVLRASERGGANVVLIRTSALAAVLGLKASGESCGSLLAGTTAKARPNSTTFNEKNVPQRGSKRASIPESLQHFDTRTAG